MVSSSHFVELPKDERDKLLKDTVPTSTRNAMAFWIRVFKEFCLACEIPCDLETVDEDTLAEVLEQFYCSMRKKDGKEHKWSSYVAARSAIHHHLKGLDRKINLRGEKFICSNKVLDAYLKDKKKFEGQRFTRPVNIV